MNVITIWKHFKTENLQQCILRQSNLMLKETRESGHTKRITYTHTHAPIPKCSYIKYNGQIVIWNINEIRISVCECTCVCVDKLVLRYIIENESGELPNVELNRKLTSRNGRLNYTDVRVRDSEFIL